MPCGRYEARQASYTGRARLIKCLLPDSHAPLQCARSPLLYLRGRGRWRVSAESGSEVARLRPSLYPRSDTRFTVFEKPSCASPSPPTAPSTRKSRAQHLARPEPGRLPGLPFCDNGPPRRI